jgi:transglutaminase-like putative cysteine protease
MRAIPKIPANLWQTLREMWRQGDVWTLLLLLLLLLMPLFSLLAAQWPLDPRVVVPILGLSLLFGYGLARSQFNEVLALIVSTTYGGLMLLFIAAWVLRGDIPSGSVEVVTRFVQWLYDFVTGGINQDPLAFTLWVGLLFWFLAYNAVWHVFRLDRVWFVILPPVLILIINLIVYSGNEPLEIYLIGFIFLALLLLVRSSLEQREYEWYLRGLRAPQNLRQSFLRVGAGLALVALLVGWLMPSGSLEERLEKFQEFLTSDPMRQLSEFVNRLVEPIESEGPASADYYGGDALTLGGAIRLGDQPILFVTVPNDRRYYWRSRVFERYSDGRWSPSAALRVSDFTPPMELNLDSEVIGGARLEVRQQITVATGGTRLIYTAPQPIQVNLSGRIDLSRTRPELNEASPVNVSVIRPQRVLERGMTYEALSLVSVATANDLRQAGTNYPLWVTNPNLDVGLNLSPRIINKAREIVTNANATTPYDQAKAIETWLRTNIVYNERIPSPPAGVDPLEWFLFDLQQGYCTYYSSAMIAMLRSLGIPSRLAAGFAQGEYDPALNQFVVRERDAHTWVEVYFPNYGWIEFEPTAAQQPINRPGDSQVQPQVQPAQQQATATLTNTPTLVPSPTPFATPTQDPDRQQQPLEDPPTATPTVTPTPTATPVIVPTVAPPIRPPEPPTTDFLSFLLPALGVGLLLFLFVLLLVALGTLLYWWWEWRGLRGLSPVARAYARLERYLVLLRLRRPPEETAEEYRERVVQKLPAAERPVTAITRTYMAERYGQQREGSADGARNARIAENAWLEARKRILAGWLRRFQFWRRD